MKKHNKQVDKPNQMKLIPLQPKERFRTEIVYNFEKINIKKHEKEPDLPTMDFSDAPWMPAFMAPYDKYFFKREPGSFKESFTKRFKKGHEDELKLLLLPKPQKKAFRFCGTCGELYEEYYEHISSVSHKAKFQDHEYVNIMQQEAQSIQAEFEKNKMEFIERTEFDSQNPDFSMWEMPINIKDPIAEKENINAQNQNGRLDISKQIMELKTAKKESEDQTNKTTKKKKIIKPNLVKDKPTFQVGNLGTTNFTGKRIDLSKVKFTEGGKLCIETEDGSGVSKSPEGKLQFLSQQNREIRQLPEGGKGVEGKKSVQMFSSFGTNVSGIGTKSSGRLSSQNSWNCNPFEGKPIQLQPQPIQLYPQQQPQPQPLPRIQVIERNWNNDHGNQLAQKRNLKRTYSTFSESEELLKKFKSVKIADVHSQSHSQSSQQQNKVSPIKIDLKTIDGGKWERFKKSFNGFVGELKEKVNQLCDYWKRKEPYY